MLNYHELRQEYRIKRSNPIKWPYMAFLTALLLLVGLGCALAGESHGVVDMTIISQIESSNNPKAYNNRSKAVGLCQITPVVLKEFNKRFHKHYSRNTLFNGKTNLMVADWYANFRIPQMLRYYGIADTVRDRIWAFNAGISNVRKHFLPKETQAYIRKYERLSRSNN